MRLPQESIDLVIDLDGYGSHNRKKRPFFKKDALPTQGTITSTQSAPYYYE